MRRKTKGIKIKRIYEPPAKEDGIRILVDRLWPRGLSKEKAKIDLWVKEVAPSDQLRKWYGHDPKKWTEFRKRYFHELKDKEDVVTLVANKLEEGTITFLYSSKEEKINNAVALKEYLLERGSME